MDRIRLSIVCISISILVCLIAAAQQTDSKDSQTDKDKAQALRETVSKPLTEKQKKKKEAQLKRELESPYRKWLNEDVSYIITDEERLPSGACRPTKSASSSSRISGYGAIRRRIR